ncbi:hypothetical protein LT85_0044 [Collimonas arenae]|uniref:Lipoprotein n=1 Tax=Collimonas arenae TaxID=279058 RepID=A0A0A1F694_9BURK|nr:hypothetical protein [Collimonas arenae]AIY39204.1 hypothetical protein LT85_0044 [Collimonas arenae]
MRLFFFVMTSFLLVACGHIAPNGDSSSSGSTSSSGNISGSSITPYGVIDTGVTRTINR